jgi:hypothetical protein
MSRALKGIMCNISHDVIFDEFAQWDWSSESEDHLLGCGDFGVKYMVVSSRIAP